MLTVLALLAVPNPVPMFGQSLDAVAKVYSATKVVESRVVSNSRFETRLGKTGRHQVRVTGVDGRVSEIEFVLGETAEVAPAMALATCGVPLEGLTVKANDARKYAQVVIQDWVIIGKPLRGGQGIYTRNAPPSKPPEQLLNLSVPSSVFFAPSVQERRTILDALRSPIERAFRGQPVEFVVTRITTVRGWAFVYGQPRRKGGGILDMAKSDFAEAHREGLYDDNVSALLRLSNGKWVPKELAIGATDVPWVDWPGKHSIPKLLFFETLE